MSAFTPPVRAHAGTSLLGVAWPAIAAIVVLYVLLVALVLVLLHQQTGDATGRVDRAGPHPADPRPIGSPDEIVELTFPAEARTPDRNLT